MFVRLVCPPGGGGQSNTLRWFVGLHFHLQLTAICVMYTNCQLVSQSNEPPFLILGYNFQWHLDRCMNVIIRKHFIASLYHRHLSQYTALNSTTHTHSGSTVPPTLWACWSVHCPQVEVPPIHPGASTECRTLIRARWSKYAPMSMNMACHTSTRQVVTMPLTAMITYR
jgi:hypothetical protein